MRASCPVDSPGYLLMNALSYRKTQPSTAGLAFHKNVDHVLAALLSTWDVFPISKCTYPLRGTPYCSSLVVLNVLGSLLCLDAPCLLLKHPPTKNVSLQSDVKTWSIWKRCFFLPLSRPLFKSMIILPLSTVRFKQLSSCGNKPTYSSYDHSTERGNIQSLPHSLGNYH